MKRRKMDTFDYVAFRHGFGDQFALRYIDIYHDILETMEYGQRPHLLIKGKTLKEASNAYTIAMVEEPLRKIPPSMNMILPPCM